jgi:hypothetical protein
LSKKFFDENESGFSGKTRKEKPETVTLITVSGVLTHFQERLVSLKMRPY